MEPILSKKTYTKAFIFGLLLITGTLYAQQDFRSGYIITLSGDTVYGEIDYRGDLFMGHTCRFKKDEKVLEYAPNDIKAYRFIDKKYYVSKKVEGKTVFLEFLINGEVNVYYLRDEEDDKYYIENKEYGMSKIPYEKKVIKYKSNIPIHYESTRHIGLLALYMQDAPDIKNRIARIKEPDHHGLIDLAKDYHNTVCEDEPCIIYEKKLPLFRLSVEPFWGMTKYNRSNEWGHEAGSYLYLWMPRTSEKLYFKTGLSYHHRFEENLRLRIFRIPLQFQYLYPSKRLKPKIGFGINHLIIDDDQSRYMFHMLTINPGLNYRISESIQLSTHLNTNFTPPLWVLTKNIPHFRLISYAVNIGLFIEL